MDVHLALWIGFNLLVALLLFVDLFLVHSRAETVDLRSSLIWSAAWIGVALFVNVIVWIVLGPQAGLEFLSSYLIEKALSADNLFVFLILFSVFEVQGRYQYRVLFWGILGAVIMRGIFILAGTALLARFGWLIYLFGAFLIFTGYKMITGANKKIDFENNWVVRSFRSIFPVSESFEDGRMFVKKDGRWMASKLFIVLIAVETTDVIFALDSIPAVLGITSDSFVAYSSNICAVLGLRSLFFALAALSKLFRHLQTGAALVLIVVGIKMTGKDFFHLPIFVTLFITVAILVGSVLYSVYGPQPKEEAKPLSPEVPT